MEPVQVTDNTAIYQAVTDYYEGWYEPDPEKMTRCLHPDLAKRTIERDEQGKQYLRHLTKEAMVAATITGGGSHVPLEKKNWTISILDSCEEIATVKVSSPEYGEYIHLAKQEGQWQIVNVLWMENRENKGPSVPLSE